MIHLYEGKGKAFSVKPLILLIITISTYMLSGCIGDKENSQSSTSAEALPNIIFFLSDDQDIYDYGCYGNEKVYTPAVDRLAKEGMLFEKAFTGQAICAPSRSQLFSGMYPLKNGCFANHTSVKPEIKTVSHYLGDLGYEVILAGKSHVKPANTFDWDHAWKPVPIDGLPRDYIPLDSIKEYFSTAEQPFCMFITSAYPHGKYFEVDGAEAADIKTFPFNEMRKEDPPFIKSKAGYYRSIEENNKQLEKVLEWVDNYLDENTLFIYSADHGVSGKFTVYDRGLNVPFVARWPKHISPGSRTSQLIHYTDVLPTFIEIAGGVYPDHFDGKSFLPLLKGEEKEIHKYVYGVRTNQNIQRTAIFPSRMIRDKRYKYIRNFNSLEVLDQNLTDKPHVNAFLRIGAMKFKEEPYEELYDLENDPFEQNNLVSLPEYQEIKRRLVEDLFSWMEDQEDILQDTPGNIPIITAKNFRLDKSSVFITVPDSLENTLTEEDYYVIEHWK